MPSVMYGRYGINRRSRVGVVSGCGQCLPGECRIVCFCEASLDAHQTMATTEGGGDIVIIMETLK